MSLAKSCLEGSPPRATMRVAPTKSHLSSCVFGAILRISHQGQHVLPIMFHYRFQKPIVFGFQIIRIEFRDKGARKMSRPFFFQDISFNSIQAEIREQVFPYSSGKMQKVKMRFVQVRDYSVIPEPSFKKRDIKALPLKLTRDLDFERYSEKAFRSPISSSTSKAKN